MGKNFSLFDRIKNYGKDYAYWLNMASCEQIAIASWR
jgi:hypothetical protein